MKRLLCSSLALFVLSMPVFAQTATSPDSSVGTGTSMNQGPGSLDSGAANQPAGASDTATAPGAATTDETQRMEETVPATDSDAAGSTPRPGTFDPSRDAEMQEDTMGSEIERQEDEMGSDVEMQDDSSVETMNE